MIFTTSEEDGPNGALLPALEEALPAAYASRIDRRGVIDSLADPAPLSTFVRQEPFTLPVTMPPALRWLGSAFAGWSGLPVYWSQALVIQSAARATGMLPPMTKPK